MMKRKDLQSKLDRLNVDLIKLGVEPYELDYARHYGGYCLTRHNGSYHCTLRMSADRLCLYMDGITLGMFHSGINPTY